VGSSAVAGGNSLNANGQGAAVGLDTYQRAEGAVSAAANTRVGAAGGVVNSASIATLNGLTGTSTADDTDVRAVQWARESAEARTDVSTGYVGHGAASAAASGNVAAMSAENGDVTADVWQDSTANVAASARAAHTYVGGQAVADAIASANNLSAAGSTTTMLTDTRQYSSGDAVSADVALEAISASDAVGNATANANALTIDNAYGYVNTRATQNAQTDVSANSEVSLSGDFLGFASAGAYGVGNSTTVSNVVSDTVMDVAQYNGGDVGASAALDVGGGGDQALASAAAYGNMVSGSLCGYCDGSQPGLNAVNDQRNEGAVHSTASIRAARAGSVAGTASAIGNAATYQVAGPGD
ncbi:MAG: holdfast anchor protein HfaD, partial [Hyphomonadaceae bacterium]